MSKLVRIEYITDVLLDKRQKKGVQAWLSTIVDRSKYKPHIGKKQLEKAAKRNDATGR